MKKENLKKMIEKEYAIVCKWMRLDWRHTFEMMIDTYDAEIWADTFLDGNSWNEYNNESVCYLQEARYSRNRKEQKLICNNILDEAVALLASAGWTIE